MPPQIANIVFAIGILGLFWLDRDPKARTSKALWIPTLWLLINGSRPVSLWFHMNEKIDSPDKYLDGSPVDAAIFGVLLVAGLIALSGRGREVRLILRNNWPILLFFFYCVLSTLWSDYSFVAFKRWTKAIGDIVMVLVVLTDTDRLAALKRLLARAAFLLVPLSVLFIKYYPDLGRDYNPWTYLPMYNGITVGKNLLGMTCLVCGLGSLWRFITAFAGEEGRERKRQLIAHGVILVMVFWLFRESDSMTSMICFTIAGGLMVLTSLFPLARKQAILNFLVAVAVSVPLFAVFSGLGGGLIKSVGRDPTLTGRTEIWQAVLSVRGDALVGTGFESFWLGDRLQRVWDLTMPGLQEAHNGYLEVFLNIGWIGVALLALVIVSGYFNVLRAIRRNQEASTLKLAFFVSGLIYSLSEAGFRMMAPVWIAFLLAAIALPDALVPKVSLSLITKHPSESAEFGPVVEDAVILSSNEEIF